MTLVENSYLGALVIVAAVVTLSPFLTAFARRWVTVPGVVVEIAFGIAIGPYVLGWASVGDVLGLLAEFGLVFLIFLAGFEVDARAVRQRPALIAAIGWLCSLAIAVGAAWALHLVDATSSMRFVAIALTATAVGILLPILGDNGLLGTPLGSHVLAGGVVGELGPILAISIVLTSDSPGFTTLVVLGFGAITVAAIWLARRSARPRVVLVIQDSLHSSGQAGVRVAVLCIVALVWAASEFGLDVLLGAFAAGLVARVFLVSGRPNDAGADVVDRREEVQVRLEAIGYGFAVPVFFVVSGMQFDLDAMFDPVEAVMIPLFLVLFLVVRGLPALLTRRDLGRHDVAALALFQASTLPMVVVISQIGLASGQMSSVDASGLIGAGLVSVIVFPILAMAVHRRSTADLDSA